MPFCSKNRSIAACLSPSTANSSFDPSSGGIGTRLNTPSNILIYTIIANAIANASGREMVRSTIPSTSAMENSRAVLQRRYTPRRALGRAKIKGYTVRALPTRIRNFPRSQNRSSAEIKRAEHLKMLERIERQPAEIFRGRVAK